MNNVVKMKRISQGKKISQDELMELSKLEETIEKHQKQFFEVGSALKAIRERHLYKNSYKTFENYCRKKWGFKRGYAYYLIKSYEVCEALNAHNCEHIPKNEAQVRPLTKVESRDKQVKIWMKAVADAPDGKVTARDVQRCIEEVLGKQKRKPMIVDSGQIYTQVVRLLSRIQATDQSKTYDQIRQWMSKNSNQ